MQLYALNLGAYTHEIIFIFRLTLLLGPPGSGKTTLLQALAGKSDDDLRVSDAF